jgi:hypothetical protein
MKESPLSFRKAQRIAGTPFRQSALAVSSLAFFVGLISLAGLFAMESEQEFSVAALRAERAQVAFQKSHLFVEGWLNYKDKSTALFPENLNNPVWTVHNSAADLWPFMVLTTYFTDEKLFVGVISQTLQDEIRLTSRVGKLPDAFSLTTHAFQHPQVDMARVIFGAAEYAKDGLLPIAEVIGRGPYFERLCEIADGLCENAPFQTRLGNIPSDSHEVNGDVMQVLARLYSATGRGKYLEMGERIASYYLFDKRLYAANRLRLRDHGGEVIGGLTETYAQLKWAGKATERHKASLKKSLDRILEVARNEHGLFYNEVNPASGEVLNKGLADTWGYVYDAFYAYYLLEGEERYRDEVRRVLKNLPNYRNYPWEGTGADGYADSIESAIVLLNREPVPEGLDWVESEIKVLLAKQRPDGVVEGWHGDGNFARTALMYALYQTQGLRVGNWRPDVKFGAVRDGSTLYVFIGADSPWEGKIFFDRPRHKTNLRLNLNYPRLNEFPEWFTVEDEALYEVTYPPASAPTEYSGKALAEGIPIRLKEEPLSLQIVVRKKDER